MYFLMAINAQRYTSLLNRANQKRQRQKPVAETQRPMYYGNSYSHEPHGQRNSNSYGNVYKYQKDALIHSPLSIVCRAHLHFWHLKNH